MAKVQTNGRAAAKHRQVAAAPAPSRGRLTASKAHPDSKLQASASGWAADLVFDVREPKLAVSLRLDADVLRFFRGFGAGYQTRINEVLKAFMHAREDVEIGARVAAAAKVSRHTGNGKRAR